MSAVSNLQENLGMGKAFLSDAPLLDADELSKSGVHSALLGDLAKGGPAAEPEEEDDKNKPSAEAKAAVAASSKAGGASAKARADSRDAHGTQAKYGSVADSHVAAAEAHHTAADAHAAAGNTWQADKHTENAKAHELAAHHYREAGKGNKESEKLIEYTLEKGGPGSGRHKEGGEGEAKGKMTSAGVRASLHAANPGKTALVNEYLDEQENQEGNSVWGNKEMFPSMAAVHEDFKLYAAEAK